MKINRKILLSFLILPFLTCFFYFSPKSDALTMSKTVVFFSSQDSLTETSVTTYSSPFTVTIPEVAATIRAAHIEISGISYNISDPQNITATIDREAELDLNPKIFDLELSTKAQQFNINYDVTSIILNTTANYTLNLTGNATGGNFSIFSAKLVLNYEYDSIQSALLKTTEFFVGQENNKTPANNAISKDFSISASESGLIIRSAFVEISGIFKGSGSGTAQAGLYPSGAVIGYDKSYNFDLGTENSTSKFIIRYDALTNINLATANNYVFYFSADKAISAWSARLYLTYEYTEPSMYPATGYVISSIFDTGVQKGAAYNSFLWNGNPNNGKVRLQLATSDCLNGKTNPPACDDGGLWSFIGPNCLESGYYESSPGIPDEIKCQDIHNNKRYFRYKVILCSDLSCAVSGPNNPMVDNVIVNWTL